MLVMITHCDRVLSILKQYCCFELRQVSLTVLLILFAHGVFAQEQAEEEVPPSEFLQQLMQSSGAPQEAINTNEDSQSDPAVDSSGAGNQDSEQSTSDYLKQLMEASGAPGTGEQDVQAEQEVKKPESQQPAGYLRLQVAEPFIELHTGPGRGFPVFHVVDRHDWIELLKRRTEWFRVRTRDGKEGWVHIANMEQTLALPGRRTEFARIKHQDYLDREYEFGVLAGDFDGANLMTIYGGYILTKNLSVELSISQATGQFTNSELYDLNLMSTPFPDWRYAPYFSLGLGHLRNKPRETFLLADETSDVTASAGIGIKAYLTRRFVFRANVREVIVFVDDDENGELIEWKLGFSFFF